MWPLVKAVWKRNHFINHTEALSTPGCWTAPTAVPSGPKETHHHSLLEPDDWEKQKEHLRLKEKLQKWISLLPHLNLSLALDGLRLFLSWGEGTKLKCHSAQCWILTWKKRSSIYYMFGEGLVPFHFVFFQYVVFANLVQDWLRMTKSVVLMKYLDFDLWMGTNMDFTLQRKQNFLDERNQQSLALLRVEVLQYLGQMDY